LGLLLRLSLVLSVENRGLQIYGGLQAANERILAREIRLSLYQPKAVL
jgi:hypothetical protein